MPITPEKIAAAILAGAKTTASAVGDTVQIQVFLEDGSTASGTLHLDVVKSVDLDTISLRTFVWREERVFHADMPVRVDGELDGTSVPANGSLEKAVEEGVFTQDEGKTFEYLIVKMGAWLARSAGYDNPHDDAPPVQIGAAVLAETDPKI